MKNWKYIEGAKTGNKNQDWDVGNIDWDVGNFNGQWYVTKNGQKLVGPFMSMKEAERYLDGHKWELQNKYGNSKIGNTQVDNTWTPDQALKYYEDAKKSNDENKMKEIKDIIRQEKYAAYKYYQELESRKDDILHNNSGYGKIAYLGDAKKKYEAWQNVASKVGNDTPLEYARRKPRVINEDKTGAEEFFKQLSDDVKEREEKDDADIEKVGNANLETSVEKGKLGLWNWYVHKDGTIVSGGTSSTEANAKEMARKALEKEKAGNKVGNSTWEEPRRMPFQPRALRYAYEQAKKKGLSGQKLEAEMLRIAKTTPHDSAATESEMRKDVSEWVLSHGKPEDFVNNKRTGNEAPDDKFAYVMREFNEGKLKTPDGKVVTDPAQAKAIAYSESKKTENGVARARKAMNKRCGNSQVTLWKGNDSVLISQDGTVQYLESNSFETDRDKYGSMQEAIDDLTKKGYRKK